MLRKTLRLLLLFVASPILGAQDEYSFGDSSTQPGHRVFRARDHYASPSRILSGDVLNGIYARGYNGTGFTTSDRSAIEIQASEDWTTTANGTSIVFKITPEGSTTPQNMFTIDWTGIGFDHTTVDTAAALAGDVVEIDGSRFDDAYVGGATANDVLYSGFRFESTYDISATVAPDTLHGLAVFAEMNTARNAQYFSAGLEASNKCFAGSLSPANAACVGSIGHTKVFNDQNIAFAFPAVGDNTRVDVFDTGFESVDFSTNGVVYVYRPEIFGGKAGMRFNMYATDTDAQILNGGNILKLPVSQVVASGATIDTSKACGGVVFLTSAGAVTTDTTNTFTVSSGSATDGTYNNGCEVTIINVDSADAITLDANARFVTFDGGNVVLGANGGAVRIASYSAGVAWVQTTLKTK